MTRRPDFIIVGAMKSATSTLHEQLARQPGIFMTTPKEPCFFSDDDVWTRGLAWYEGLFAGAAPDDLCGEASTHYTKAPILPRTVERMQGVLGAETRFIYVMRHPIDRLVSHYMHEWTQGVIATGIDEALDDHPALVEFSRYAMQIEPYLERWGPANVLPVFFDAIATHPQRELTRVCRFIGATGDAAWHDDDQRHNVSSERLRVSSVRDFLMNLPGATWLRRTLLSEGVRGRIKSRWQMRQRPDLSVERRDRLTEAFDADLARLGRWLDLDLDCSTFRDVTREATPAWTAGLRDTLASEREASCR